MACIRHCAKTERGANSIDQIDWARDLAGGRGFDRAANRDASSLSPLTIGKRVAEWLRTAYSRLDCKASPPAHAITVAEECHL